MIAYMLRGLTLAKKGGTVSGKGSAKLSCVMELTGLSERGARYARGELISRDWISRDTGSTQWKLNRDGAYFSINLGWSKDPLSKSGRAGECLAPLKPPKCPSFAPPNKDRKTPYGSKNQKTYFSGVLKREGIKDSVPSLWNVQKSD